MWKTISPAYAETADALCQFTLNSFNDEGEVDRYVSEFGLDDLCRKMSVDRSRDSESVADVEPIKANFRDLCRLHYLALTRRVLTTLEFGSGYSTVVLAQASKILKEHFGDWAASNVRVERPFHVYSIEEEQRYLEITNARLGESLGDYATVQRSSVDMILHDNRIATVYTRLPNVSPDFIYLDGPSQFATTSELNGFQFGHVSRMPMAADILRLEFFFEPGTLILVDGRTANSRFLQAYLKRNWAYRHDLIGDVHYFELQEDPLGKFNKQKLEFCLGGQWLLKSS